MEYEDELDRMRNRKRRPAVRQTEIKKQTVSRRYAEPEKRQGTRKRQEMRLEYEDFSDARQANRSRKAVNSKAAGGSYMSGSSQAAGRGKQGNGQSKVHQMAAQNRKTRAQKKKRKQKVVAGILLIAALVIGLILFFMKKKDDGYWTVAVFGVDSRDGNLEKDTHSDVEMICVVDKKTGEIRISSVFRDTYMQVSAEGKYHKINQAYFDGGHKQAMDALERNLDLQIDDYATFNWKAVADAITILGGIDIDISDSTISRITDKILPIVKEWQERPLEEVYAVVFMDAIHYHVRSEGRIVKRAVYIALGIDMNGKKDVLGMYVGENESAKFWLSIMNGLKNRGVEDILIACVDGLNGFPQAIEAVYPKTEIQQCIIHQIRNSTKFVSYKDIKKLMADLKLVYAAPTEETALNELELFKDKWDSKYPKIYKSWHDNWATLSTYFKYPEAVRRLIYTTNAIEGFNRQLRKVTKSKTVFPSDDSLLKMLYLATMDITKKWTRHRQDWGQIHSQLEIYFEERLAGRNL